MSWKHLSDTMPTARKKHVCMLCGLPIAAGEKHVARRGVNDGEMTTARMHIVCEAMTIGWTIDDWELHDAQMFRKEHGLEVVK